MELNDERYDDHDNEYDEDDNEDDENENDAFVSTKGELSYTNT